MVALFDEAESFLIFPARQVGWLDSSCRLRVPHSAQVGQQQERFLAEARDHYQLERLFVARQAERFCAVAQEVHFLLAVFDLDDFGMIAKAEAGARWWTVTRRRRRSRTIRCPVERMTK